MNKKILQIAIPSVISNITIPLLGLIDLTIVGHLGVTAYIGAIAVGGMLFNLLYWAFGFLRMGTSGMTSQAYGRRDFVETSRILIRSLGVGLIVGLVLFLLQRPVEDAAFYFIKSGHDVQKWASIYFRICIWGAPAVLSLYGFTGWFIGMQNTRIPMIIAITQNIINIVCSLSFVYLWGMQVEGVAYGTLIAQYSGLFMAIWCWIRFYRRHQVKVDLPECFKASKMKEFFSVNRDIFFRTLCLLAVTTFFTSAGARQGDVLLAVNTLLMQLFTLFSYILDGFSYAGEALGGKYVGAGDAVQLRRFVRQLFKWGTGMSLFFTLLYLLGGKELLAILTNDPAVISASNEYFYWVLAIPLVSFSAFLWDGIFIGATATRYMLYAVGISSATFFLVYYGFRNELGNHALWMAFIVYLSLRGILQTFWRKAALKM